MKSKMAIVDLAIRTKLMLDSIDSWLIRQPSLVNKRRRSLYPIVGQRTALADSLARYLTTLGIDRKLQDVPALDTYLEKKIR